MPKALLFDVFGTVVDWRSGVMLALTRQFPDADSHDLALAWRALYQPSMAPIRNAERAYTPLDVLHRENLEQVLSAQGLACSDAETLSRLSRAWHCLPPWPDSIPGLMRLKATRPVAALSNGNVALMVNLSRFAGLPWDAILGADWALDYKPAPRVYLAAVEALGLTPSEVMMVAAHNADLAAAQALGLRTGFVPRPLEYGPGQTQDLTATGDWDIQAPSLTALALQLEAVAP